MVARCQCTTRTNLTPDRVKVHLLSSLHRHQEIVHKVCSVNNNIVNQVETALTESSKYLFCGRLSMVNFNYVIGLMMRTVNGFNKEQKSGEMDSNTWTNTAGNLIESKCVLLQVFLNFLSASVPINKYE